MALFKNKQAAGKNMRNNLFEYALLIN